MADKITGDMKAYKRQYEKERREWLKEHHFCVECGKQDAYTLNGKYRCYECNEKHNKKSKDTYNSEKMKIYNKVKYTECKNNGICVICKKRKAVDGKSQCSVCLAKSREKYHKNNSSVMPRYLWSSYGLCYRCGNKLDGQLNTNGDKSKLCSVCYSVMKYPKTKILFTPFKKTKNSMETWNKMLEKREELLANGTYDYMPIVNSMPRR